MTRYTRFFCLLLTVPIITYSQFSQEEMIRWKAEAKSVTIIRDTWGVPHIYSKTDAGAVFGLLYAQCEESFERVEENNLEMLGRLSEKYGEDHLYNDLEMRLIYDTAAAIQDYHNSPMWLQKLLDAAADGVNYYLSTHPAVKPAVLTRFEPWFALLRTNGSISATQNGGITTADMKELYAVRDSGIAFLPQKSSLYNDDPMGSNGFAVAPSKTADGKAILYINPHVYFYFRSEAGVQSDEGLHAYGGVTWGTFFVFQGFNQVCGWMHTSGQTDVADLFTETVVAKGDSLYTKYDEQLMPVERKKVTIRYKKGEHYGEHTFVTYHTVHGPVMGSRKGQWLSLRENNRSLEALKQSWLRTKARSFEEFKDIMNLRANTSDNTVYADSAGNIAYWHGNFVPRRSQAYNYSLPVDGSTSKSDWHGMFSLDSIVHVYNPATGFIQNCNSSPFTVSGSSSPERNNYPVYMAPDGENYRGITAVRLLSGAKNITPESMIHNIGYSHYLSLFDDLLPAVINAFDSLAPMDSLVRRSMKEPVALLKGWDHAASDTSVASALAIELGYRMLAALPPASEPYKASHAVARMQEALQQTTAAQRIDMLAQTLADLTRRFGTWRVTWGDINRYQRPADGVFSDAKPSLPVGFAASSFGSLPAFVSRQFPGSDKRYGIYGNSFVACVAFGKKTEAKSVVTGGQSFDPQSTHYLDQADRFIEGNFKDVLFYKDDVIKHAERTYQPGG